MGLFHWSRLWGVLFMRSCTCCAAQDLGNAQEADAAFSTALTICPSLPDGWLSWAVFCDEQYVASRDPTLLESAATSYLQVCCNASHWGDQLRQAKAVQLSLDLCSW